MTNNFQEWIMPTTERVQSSVVPTEKIDIQEWFKQTNASSLVAPKPTKLDRHVFDMDVYANKPKKFTLNKLFSILSLNSIIW